MSLEFVLRYEIDSCPTDHIMLRLPDVQLTRSSYVLSTRSSNVLLHGFSYVQLLDQDTS